MNDKHPPAWKNRHLLGLALFLWLSIVGYHLFNAARGGSFYRDIHLGAALDYAKHGIDLMNPVIVGFNATHTPTPQEFPIWQAAAAVAFKIFGTWFGWANLTSLLFFSTCLYPVFRLAEIFFGRRVACWTLVFFLAEPLVFYQSGVASTDGTSLAAAIWFLFSAVRLLQAPDWKWWILTIGAGVASVLLKLPFFMSAGLAVFFFTAMFHRHSLKPWIMLGSAAVIIGGVFMAWTHHTNKCIGMAEYPYVDLRLSNPEMKFWYFGSIHYLLTPSNWIKGGWRVLNCCFAGSAMICLFLFSLIAVRQHVFAKLWLLGCLLTMLLFSHLVLHHWHYYLMFTPSIAILCALAATTAEKHLSFEYAWQKHTVMVVIALGLLIPISQALITMKTTLQHDPFPRQMVALIDKYTAPTDKILIGGGAWGGNELILSKREGLSIWSTQFLEDPKTYARLKELGYTKLVMISESPLQIALQHGNPGEKPRDRESYKKNLTPVAQSWPALIENEDIVIKEIP